MTDNELDLNGHWTIDPGHSRIGFSARHAMISTVRGSFNDVTGDVRVDVDDLDAAVGYTEYYLAAGVSIEKEIFAPPAPDEFAGQLTIGTRWKDTENIKNLLAAFKDPAAQEFLRTDPRVKDILLPL
mgnify:CR=1 FL=1